MTSSCLRVRDRLAHSERFDAAHRAILTKHFDTDLVRKATKEEDIEQATDWIVGRDIRIAAKVRDFRYLESGDFGLRTRAEGGHKSEWQKIREGRADLLLHTIADEDESSIARWWLIDLATLRRAQKMLWLGCHQPAFVDIPAKDVHLILFRLDGIAERYGKLVLAEGVANA